MILEDVEEVYAIEKNTFSHPWSRDAFTKELTTNKHSIYMVIEQNKQILAYGGLWNVTGEGYITNIAVKKDNRGFGLGRKVTQALISEGRKEGVTSFTLEVRTSNNVAINLYKKLGFEIAGIRKNFYDRPKEDAYIMWKKL
jgi:ribosomal-protein-alanine N-acetyltransferase